MYEQESLFAIVEFGVGLAGFAAVFVALVRRAGAWEAASAYRLELLLVQSLAASLFALLPVSLRLLGVEPSLNWRLSSGLLAMAHIGGLVYARGRYRRLPGDARRELSRVLLHGGTVLMLLSAAVLVLNGLGVLFAPQEGPYFLVLVSLLVASVLNFVRTVTTRPGPVA